MYRAIILLLVCISLNLLSINVNAAMKSIGKDKVNIRSDPGTNGRVVFKAPLGYPVDVKSKQGKWVLIEDWQKDSGWVYQPLVSDVQTAVVLVDNANIRKGPGTTNNIVMKAEKGDIFKVFGEQDNWVTIGYYLEEKKIGWIRKDLVFGD